MRIVPLRFEKEGYENPLKTGTLRSCGKHLAATLHFYFLYCAHRIRATSSKRLTRRLLGVEEEPLR